MGKGYKTKRGKYHEWIGEEGCIKIEGWAKDGLTNEQIAQNMGITSETLRVWNNKYSVISAALKQGKEVVDRQVENALLKRALGYTYEEVKQVIEFDAKGKERKRQEKIIRTVTPDVTVQIFWLKNRKPEQWRSYIKDSLDIREQESKVEHLETKTKAIQGISEEIENTKWLRDMLIADE